MCSESALLGDLLGVSRSRERDLLSVLLIYSRFFLCVFIVYCRVLFCYMLMNVDCFGLVVSTSPPFCICFVMLVMRKGGESSWSGTWHLCCTLEVFHVHSDQDQFIQPGWAEYVFLCIFSLGLCFACSFVPFGLFVSPFFVFPWAVESSPLQFLALA